MKQKNYFIVGIIALLFAVIITGCAQEKPISSTMEYTGTKYINCHLNPNYPVQIPNQINTNAVILIGVASEVPGTRTCLISGTSVNNKLLFDTATNDVSRSYGDNLNEIIGKPVRIKGYSGGKKTVCAEEYDVFYITDIIDWRNICCDATLGETGNISTPNVCFWFRK